jgi:nicotinate-nucleotide adenylyltransferase
MSKQTMEIEGGRRIGLFGGTFNPIHLGHLRGGEEIREAFGLQEVIFIPAAIPPHKVTEKVIEARHRLEMVKLAIVTNPHFSISSVELERPGNSYSIDTLQYFRERDEDAFFFILGRDAFVEIETWKDFQRLFSLSNFVVMTRPGFGKAPLPAQLPEALMSVFQYDQEVKAWTHTSGHTLYFKEITLLDISSTKVRELVEKGESVKYLIPNEVEAYINQHGLYRKN